MDLDSLTQQESNELFKVMESKTTIVDFNAREDDILEFAYTIHKDL